MTDEEIEAAVIAGGVYWYGDAEHGGYWKIEDADLHPLIRGLLADERERTLAEIRATTAA